MEQVFISRPLEAGHSILVELAMMGVEVNAKSMIRTMPVAFDRDGCSADWLFFFSSNAVNFFFEQRPTLIEGLLFAAVGPATGRTLEKHAGISFIGKGSDTSLVVAHFAAILRDGSVMVPCAEHAMNPLRKVLSPQQMKEVVCYRTESNPSFIGQPKVLVFSSPSNVRSFLLANEISVKQKIISFGPSTSAELSSNGLQVFLELPDTQVEFVLNAIKDALCS